MCTPLRFLRLYTIYVGGGFMKLTDIIEATIFAMLTVFADYKAFCVANIFCNTKIFYNFIWFLRNQLTVFISIMFVRRHINQHTV